MELVLSVILGFMIIGAVYALNARDLLSALISCSVVGYGLVICFLLLKAPDLAIVQIVVETITLVIMVAVVLNSTREELKDKVLRKAKKIAFGKLKNIANIALTLIIAGLLLLYFISAIEVLDQFGIHQTRMATAYITDVAGKTGSANLVTGVLFDFRAYDTLGEATILFTAIIGILTVLRIKGKKDQ